MDEVGIENKTETKTNVPRYTFIKAEGSFATATRGERQIRGLPSVRCVQAGKYHQCACHDYRQDRERTLRFKRLTASSP